ncbi:unnamed protein product [Arctogadus glacialis]
MDPSGKKRKGGAERARDQKKAALQADATKCLKIADMFAARGHGASTSAAAASTGSGGEDARQQVDEAAMTTAAFQSGRDENRNTRPRDLEPPQCGQLGLRGDGARHPSSSLGSLRVPQGLPSDCGGYKCVAVNRHGVDTLAMEVNVTRHPGPGRGERRSRRPDSGGGLRTTWRRPAVPWKPAQPRVDARQPAADARRRVNAASNKIDGRKWADIPAKVRGKTGQNGVTAANTVRQTQTSEKRRTFIGETAISEGNVEGSGEGGAMQEKKEEVLHITTTPRTTTTPTPTHVTSTADNKPEHGREQTHNPRDLRHAHNAIHATPDPRRTHNTQLR